MPGLAVIHESASQATKALLFSFHQADNPGMRLQRPATGHAGLLPIAIKHSPAAVNERHAKRNHDNDADGEGISPHLLLAYSLVAFI